MSGALVRTRERAPVRIVHLGLGAFHRAHQAWYTAHASDAAEWGIAAFTGRGPAQADLLRSQDGLYTLVERGPERDRVEVVESIVEAHDGAELGRLLELLGDPTVTVVTLTITEAGYRLTPDGRGDLGDPVVAGDLARIQAAIAAGAPLAAAAPEGALTRLVLGLEARRRGGGAPIAIVPCDNIPDNGALTRSGVLDLAAQVSAELRDWIQGAVGFVGTSVDRITPRAEDVALGWPDAAPVVTEPFADWTLMGEFPAARPDWESAGARFVDDLAPWEHRKLWLLNGAHSLLAYAGLPAGHRTVADAMVDPDCRGLVEDFWAEAVALLPAGVEHTDYRRALVERFANARIAHPLQQIAAEGASKVRYRLAAVAERTRRAGGEASASAAGIGAWIGWLRGGGRAPDGHLAAVEAALAAPDPVRALLRLVSPALAEDEQFTALIHPLT